MSRLFEALQKSQGENPSASPLASGQQEATAPSEATEAIHATAVAVAAGVPIGTPTDTNWLNVPADRILHPTPTPEQRLVALAAPDSAGAEMFRVLATRLAHMQNKRQLQKLLITSSVGDEGKSVVAVNLALTLARRPSARTLLIEADLRRPSASKLLTSSSLRGISDWDEGKLAIEDSLYQVNDLPLWFLSAGHGMKEPLPLLESERFAKMLETVSSSFDWVVLDATPMLPMADSTSLARLCDGVLVVVREGHTHRKVLNKALESIERNKLLGMVFNEASMSNAGYESYYGGNNSSGKSKKDLKKESDKVTAATA